MALFGSRSVAADKLPDDMDSLKKKAEKLLEKKDLQGAFICCEKAASLPDTYQWFHGQLAEFYAKGEVCEKNLKSPGDFVLRDFCCIYSFSNCFYFICFAGNAR